MKHQPLILVVLCAAFTLASCKKEHSSATFISNEIVGKWTWIRTDKIAPPGPNNPETPANTGRQESIAFHVDVTWYRWINQQLTGSGTFTLGKGTYQVNPNVQPVLYDSVRYINGTTYSTDYYKISQDTMVFYGAPGAVGAERKWWVRSGY